MPQEFNIPQCLIHWSINNRDQQKFSVLAYCIIKYLDNQIHRIATNIILANNAVGTNNKPIDVKFTSIKRTKQNVILLTKLPTQQKVGCMQ